MYAKCAAECWTATSPFSNDLSGKIALFDFGLADLQTQVSLKKQGGPCASHLCECVRLCLSMRLLSLVAECAAFLVSTFDSSTLVRRCSLAGAVPWLALFLGFPQHLKAAIKLE